MLDVCKLAPVEPTDARAADFTQFYRFIVKNAESMDSHLTLNVAVRVA